MLWIILIAIIGAAYYEYPRLKREKRRKEWWLFLFFSCFALAMTAAQVWHMPLPDPLDWLTAIYKPLSRTVFSVLE